MESKFGKGVKTPTLKLEQGAELERWNRFIRRFEIAVIGAGLEVKGKKTKKDEEERTALERRKAVLLLDGMGEIGMDIFESWETEVAQMQ